MEPLYDVIIIGGGVVGCGTFYHLSVRRGMHCLLLEKLGHVAGSAASAGNSGIFHAMRSPLHSSLAAHGPAPSPPPCQAPVSPSATSNTPECPASSSSVPPTEASLSVEHECLRASSRQFPDLVSALGVPFRECGSLLVAWSSTEVAALSAYVARANAMWRQEHDAYGPKSGTCEEENGTFVRANDMTGPYRLLSREEALALEPNLSSRVHAGLAVDGDGVVDPSLLPAAMASYASSALGGAVLTRREVVSIRCRGDSWLVRASTGEVFASRALVNCAGLHADAVEALRPDARLPRDVRFRLRPVKGEFIVYARSAGACVRRVIMPVPGADTRGVLVFPTVYGNVVVGPTAEPATLLDESDEGGAAARADTRKELRRLGESIVPELANHRIIGSYTGLRPATAHTNDYIIRSDTCYPTWITVAGIRSTGLSGALGIAGRVSSLLSSAKLFARVGSRVSINEDVKLCLNNNHEFCDGFSTTYGKRNLVVHPISRFGNDAQILVSKL